MCEVAATLVGQARVDRFALSQLATALVPRIAGAAGLAYASLVAQTVGIAATVADSANKHFDAGCTVTSVVRVARAQIGCGSVHGAECVPRACVGGLAELAIVDCVAFHTPAGS